jgi:hypothetical protein
MTIPPAISDASAGPAVMPGGNSLNSPGVKLPGPRRVPGNQDARMTRLLRLGVGVTGILLPIALIAGNWVAGDKVIVPDSMSGSYYTSTCNLFAGSLCALAVFLIGYRHTRRQACCTWFAGVCAALVVLAPTAPAPPKTEPAWVSYLHHSAAGALIFTLGVFCWVVFAGSTQPGEAQPQSMADRCRAWVACAGTSLRHGGRHSVYLACGFLVFASGGLALYTGIWPASWSTGWQSLYMFEAVAVFASGAGWITAGLEGP